MEAEISILPLLISQDLVRLCRYTGKQSLSKGDLLLSGEIRLEKLESVSDQWDLVA